MKAADLSDDELLLLATGPVDNLAKQRKRGPRPASAPAESPHAHLSDEEILAAIGGEPKKPEAYQPTDYAGENRAGPYTQGHQEADTRDRAEANAAVLSGDGESGLMDGGTQEQRAYVRDKGNARSQEEQAKDFARFSLGGLIFGPLAGAGRAAGMSTRVANVAGGSLAGAVPALSAGGTPSDIGLATILGGIGGAALGARAAKAAHEPRAQNEIDAAVIQRGKQIHPDPRLQMEGTRENVRLAEEADRLLEARQSGRKAGNGALLDNADADYSMLDSEYPIPDTSQAIDKLQGVREQSHGGQGPMLSSDRPLAEMQRQLTIGRESTPMVPRGELRNVQKTLNEEARFERAQRGATRAEGALQQGAGIVADTARAADPRLGPGNLGGALDKYGATEDAMANVDALRGPEGGRVSKLARVGGAGKDAGEGAVVSENDVSSLQQAEPVANSLIDRIRYNNTVGRRSMRLPYIGYGMAGNVERLGKANLGNLAFKLRPPQIDAEGMVAAQPARDPSIALPLELELMLLSREQDKEKRR